MESTIDVVKLPLEEEPPSQLQENSGQSFYDTANPIFAPAKETISRKSGWKKKLVGWLLLAIAILVSVFGLYYLLKVKRVDVTVLADNSHKSTTIKPQPSPPANENGLSAEAINIAREAIGPDPANANPSQGTNVITGQPKSLNSLTKPSVNNGASTSVGLSPVNDFPTQESELKANANEPPTVNKQQNSPPANTVIESHANSTQSLFVDDSQPKPIAIDAKPKVAGSTTIAIPSKPVAQKTSRRNVELPPFGTMLPVRTQTAVFTLRNDSYARLEITRDTSGEGWSLPKGTVFVGHTKGSDLDRAYINIIGYIDPHENRLTRMTGEVLGGDGVAGLQGRRVSVDPIGFKHTLSKVASNGLQVAGMMAGALTGRGTVVINGPRLLNPITDDAGRLVSKDEKRTFVKVDAGQIGYVMVAELPKQVEPQVNGIEDESNSLSDRDVMELLLFGTQEELRVALPLMTDQQRTWAVKNEPKP